MLFVGSTSIVRSYQACPLLKSVAGIPPSASTGFVFRVNVFPPSLLTAIPPTLFACSVKIYTVLASLFARAISILVLVIPAGIGNDALNVLPPFVDLCIVPPLIEAYTSPLLAISTS